jgi:hypothetical protein
MLRQEQARQKGIKAMKPEKNAPTAIVMEPTIGVVSCETWAVVELPEGSPDHASLQMLREARDLVKRHPSGEMYARMKEIVRYLEGSPPKALGDPFKFASLLYSEMVAMVAAEGPKSEDERAIGELEEEERRWGGRLPPKQAGELAALLKKAHKAGRPNNPIKQELISYLARREDADKKACLISGETPPDIQPGRDEVARALNVEAETVKDYLKKHRRSEKKTHRLQKT